MQPYLFIGSEPRFYIRHEGVTFTAQSGEVRSFTDPPTDGLWVPVPKAPKPAPSDSEESK